MEMAIAVLIVSRIKTRRKRFNLENKVLLDKLNPFAIDDTQFVKNYCLTKPAVHFLINSIQASVTQRRSTRTPVHLQVLCALAVYATGGHNRFVGNTLVSTVSQATVTRSVIEVTNAIVKVLFKKWVRLPRNDKEKHLIKSQFLSLCDMHNIIGAVDGTQIAIAKPRVGDEGKYVNHNGYHSLNVQIVCDADMRIINVNPRFPGSCYNSYVWSNSSLLHSMCSNYNEGDTDTWLAGDSGYPCQPWLLTPVNNPSEGSPHIKYNVSLERTRVIAEQCIGMLKARFRCLQKERTLRYSPAKAAKIILACCVLHNMAVHYNVEQLPLELDDADKEPVAPNFRHEDVAVPSEGEKIRELYIQKYFS